MFYHQTPDELRGDRSKELPTVVGTMSEFFDDFDLAAAGLKIHALGVARGSSDVFAEAIEAIYFRIKNSRVLFSELEEWLGAPSRTVTEGNSKIAEYDWEQFVAGNRMQASTRFLVVDDYVQRVLPSK
ncbi:hypothetical protein J2W27_004539 [Variovorax boronicumulans]|uniref:hypothetical protein n=1 Tax=Variovorax boronicumulans TaxID=436515 RepID=UPI00277F3198|nr:hypothetical protein [Variovorax boronicumulans]MDP9912413.1 hypothetical protein [Variovorax boronicumulans]